LTSFLRFIGAAIPSAAAGVLLAFVLGLGHSDGFGSATVVGAIVSLVIIGAVMSLVYLGALFLLRSPELRGALGSVRSRLNR
jgi:putative peptidoglycan lipid II flippase